MVLETTRYLQMQVLLEAAGLAVSRAIRPGVIPSPAAAL